MLDIKTLLPELKKLVTDLSEAKSSEDNLRNLYRRWADFMDADSWDVLANWRSGSGA